MQVLLLQLPLQKLLLPPPIILLSLTLITTRHNIKSSISNASCIIPIWGNHTKSKGGVSMNIRSTKVSMKEYKETIPTSLYFFLDDIISSMLLPTPQSSLSSKLPISLQESKKVLERSSSLSQSSLLKLIAIEYSIIIDTFHLYMVFLNFNTNIIIELIIIPVILG